MTKKHLLWWVLDFIKREHPESFDDLKNNIKGDKDDPWVKASLDEKVKSI